MPLLPAFILAIVPRSPGVNVHRPPGTGSFFGPSRSVGRPWREGRKMCLSPRTVARRGSTVTSQEEGCRDGRSD
jgi:hypothetical protein